MRKSVAIVAATAGVALALPATLASAGDNETASARAAATGGPGLSPETRTAWKDFIEGGGISLGGASRMVSDVWVGAPAILAATAGEELSPAQVRAWKNWDEGADDSQGAAEVISEVYVGAPGYILDQIEGGATPADLSPAEMRQVSFMMPVEELTADGRPANGVSTDDLPDGLPDGLPDAGLLLELLPLELLVELLPPELLAILLGIELPEVPPVPVPSA
ncbi:MAG: type III effector [Nocardioidaceae bacterium]